MEIKRGIAVSPGVAIAPAFVLESEELRIPKRKVRPEEVAAELARLETALDAAELECREQQESARSEVGDAIAGMFAAHSMIVRDPGLHREFTAGIRDELRSAEYAVSTVMRTYSKRLSAKGGLMAERVADVHDVERRLLHHLVGGKRENLANLSSEVVVIAQDLTPSQTTAMDRSKVMGFATDHGGRTSHVAILARALGMPAVVGLKNLSIEVSGGDPVIIDGNQGLVIIKPDRLTRERYRDEVKRRGKVEVELAGLRDAPAVTADGVPITVLGNIEFPHEVDDCIRNGAAGVGLYRTEFLYLGAQREPGEEDQYRAYCEVVRHCGGRPVTIRTLDLGADKYSEHLVTAEERNPFLGVRSIRLCLQRPEMFKTQLRAILRAGTGGKVKIMFPLVTTVTELRQAKALLSDVTEDLEDDGIPYARDVDVGIMVEVPAAAYILERFAPEVSFFSVGTNDLVQYMLAVDRGNEKVAHLYNPANPAVLRMLKHIVDVSDAHKVEVSLCGEMGGDPEFIPLLLGLGFRHLSVTSSSILELKRIVRSVTMVQARTIAEKALSLDSDREVVSFLKEANRRLLPDEAGPR